MNIDPFASKKTILIVDDEPANVMILSSMLKSDYTTLAVTHGEKALRLATADSPPDLILLDVVMPGMDGYEVCRRLKADPQASKIPVIFITGKDGEQDEVKGFEAGAVDYVTKPFSAPIIKARVHTHIELKKLRDYLEWQSHIDGLTGIPNRRCFDEYLAAKWDPAGRETGVLSLIIMDIDYFKNFNDHYGHQAGDECLKTVARTLQSALKNKNDLLARYGGEEFACILPGTEVADAARIAEELRRSILELRIPHAYSSAASCVTISLGAATASSTAESSPLFVLKAADEGLYKAKEAGRNRICGTDLRSRPKS